MSTWVKKLPAVAITVALMIALSPVSAAFALSASTGSVNGFVKSANNGNALANVKVRVFDMNSSELVTEMVTTDEGALDFSELPFGLYQVTVVPPAGYAAAAGPLVNLTDEAPDATVGFNLEALPGTPTSAQAGGFPLLGILAIIGAGVGVTLAAIAVKDGEPDVPVGTQ